MRNFLWAVLLLAVTVASGFAQEEKPAAAPAKKEAKSSSAAPDKALMQKVWDAWVTMDPANPAKYYAKGAGHVFYDITPLKYNSWDEYETGVKQVLAGFQSIKATVNDDAEVHRHGNLAWSTATVHHDDVMKDGKKDQGDFRWTAIWEKTGKEWLIVHEHVSAPLGAEAGGKSETKSDLSR